MKIPSNIFKNAIFIQFLDDGKNIEIQKRKNDDDVRFIFPFDNISEIHVAIYLKKPTTFDLNLDKFLENFNIDL